jgi:hypothetical protein
MNALKRGVCVLGLFVGLVSGCATTDFFNLSFLQTSTPGGDRVLVGSLETVSDSTQKTLSRLGMAANVSRQGEEVHIASATPSGAKFKFVLKREKGKDGEQTRVRIEWEGKSDEQTAFQVLSQLDLSNRR